MREPSPTVYAPKIKIYGSRIVSINSFGVGLGVNQTDTNPTRLQP